MYKSIGVGLAGCLLLSLSVGCATNPGLVRAQSPGAFTPAQPASLGYSSSNATYGSGAVCGCGSNCGGNCGCGCDRAWRPTHLNTYKYNTPRNLVYPPQNQPGAVVQYPYYTVKGPSDFFMK